MQAQGYRGYFKTIITFTAVFLLLALLYSTYLSYRASISAAESSFLPFLHHQDRDIESHLQRYADDILFLTEVPPTQGIIRAREAGGYDSLEKTSYGVWVRRQKQIFESLGTGKTEYLHIRYIDEKGNELVRVDFKEGKVRNIPDTELQNKADRYFFTEAMKLSAGQVYFSNIGLSQEQGKIVVPYQPTLRIATPVFDKSGQPRGIIIANVDSQFLLHTHGLMKSQRGEEIYVVDQEGYFLHHSSDPAREWGAPVDLNTGKNLKAYQPDLFGKIMDNDMGMAFSFDSYRFVLFSRIEFPHMKGKYLVIVHEVSPFVILAPMFRTVIVGLSFIFFFSVVLYFFVRHATGQIREKEAALKKIHEDLELLVQERTKALAEANKLLDALNTAQSKVALRTRELEAAKLEAEAANRAKSDFLASMSHELRTPLNAIIGFSQVLQAKYYGELNEKQVEYVTDILDSGNHLLSLINDILDLSKVEAGKMQLELSRVEITALLKNSLLMIQEKALQHGITVELKIPAAPEGLEMEGDERKLKQILFNFLSNAAKFTPDGGRITVQARRVKSLEFGAASKEETSESDADFIEISVADTGIGIRAEDQKRVFEPFVQVQGGTTDKTPGTGLGLSLTKAFVELHRGRIWVESEGLGKGSRFYVLLPVQGR